MQRTQAEANPPLLSSGHLLDGSLLGCPPGSAPSIALGNDRTATSGRLRNRSQLAWSLIYGLALISLQLWSISMVVRYLLGAFD